MNTYYVFDTPQELGAAVADNAYNIINDCINKNGYARILLATGASQFETFKNLRTKPIDWSKVEMFHLDEYIGIDSNHKASFVKYLKERFIGDDIILKAVHFIDGMKDPLAQINDLTKEIRKAPIDLALIGIGENAHIAFNDPPADFDTEEAFIIVELDEACKKQQVREEWFNTIDDVPKTAITMTPYQIMQSKIILSAVPHIQKADAVKATLESPIINTVPSTILRNHANWTLYLDTASASKLKK